MLLRLFLLGLLAFAPPVFAQGEAPVIPATDIDQVRSQRHPVVLDVRTAEEVRTLGALPDSIHIPVDELESRLEELPRDRVILTA